MQTSISLPEPLFPTSRYPSAWLWPAWSIDYRHLYWLYDVLASGLFESALEIGCLHGASSTAFVEALNAGALRQATFCDIEVRPEFRQVLAQCTHPERCRTFEGRSADLLQQAPPYDFVFVDGDHSLETVREEVEHLLRRGDSTVMAHDTSAQTLGYPNLDGPAYLKWVFQTTPGFLCLEDNAQRPGELTRRGLFLATTRPEVFEVARKALKKWGALVPPD